MAKCPIGERRFKQHVDQLIRNLSNGHESGRLAVLAAIGCIMQRLTNPHLPQKQSSAVMRGHNDPRQQNAPKIACALFLPLTLVLANDESAACRAGAARCVSQMFSCGGLRILGSAIRFVKRWLRDEDAKSSIRCAAAQVVSAAAESCPEKLSCHVRPLYHLLGVQLKAVCDNSGLPDLYCAERDVSTSKLYDHNQRNSFFKWDVAFHALIAVEKLMLNCVPVAAQEVSVPPNPGMFSHMCYVCLTNSMKYLVIVRIWDSDCQILFSTRFAWETDPVLF